MSLILIELSLMSRGSTHFLYRLLRRPYTDGASSVIIVGPDATGEFDAAVRLQQVVPKIKSAVWKHFRDDDFSVAIVGTISGVKNAQILAINPQRWSWPSVHRQEQSLFRNNLNGAKFWTRYHSWWVVSHTYHFQQEWWLTTCPSVSPKAFWGLQTEVEAMF